MDETDFKMIVTLSQVRNITKAADVLNLSQSAISKRINNIESELDTKIFLRSHSGVEFTPSGEKILSYCTAVCEHISEMRLFLNENQNDVYGNLSLGISENYTQYHLAELVAGFHKKYPNVNLNIRTNRGHLIFPLLVSDKINIAIVRGEYNWNEYKIRLSSEAMCVVCNKEYEGRNLNDFMYIDRSTDTTQYAQMNRWRHENNIRQSSNMITVDSITTCMDLVKKGLGWAIIPEVALTDYTGCVTPCRFASGELFVRNTYLYCRSEVAELPHAKAFIEEARSKTIIYPFAGKPTSGTK